MAEDQKFNFPTPLHLACCTDELRPVLEYVHFIDGYAYATDGHVLVKQSIAEYCTVYNKEQLSGRCLHRDSFENIRKFDNAQVEEDGLKCWDYNGGKEAFFPFGSIEDKIPDFEKIIHEVDAESVPFIGINPKYVEVVGKCLQREKRAPLRFTFTGIARPILVTAEGFADQCGVIMPVLLGGNLF